jgi:hypothetical protein
MNDNPVDPHLRAALRHAPDVDLVPPTALDQRIKSAARQALQPSHPASRDGSRWAHLRAWLHLLSKPPGAAALATVALGTVMVVMWQGQVPPEAMPGAASSAANLPAVAVRPGHQASASVRPQVSESVRAAASPQTPPAATPIAGAPATVRPPTVVAQAAAPAEPRHATRAAPEAAVPATVATPAPPALTAPPAPPAPRAAEPAGRAVDTEVPAVVSAPLPSPRPTMPAAPVAPTTAAAPAAPLGEPDSPPSTTAQVVAAAPAAPTAPAVPAAKSAGESRSATDFARPLALSAAAAAPRLPPHPSPALAELAAAAAGPWQSVPARQMPEGGKLVRDAQGIVLGRMLVEPDWLWWQPWADAQAAPLALRAPARRAASAP